MICALCADWIGQKGETKVQQHKHDWQQSELAQLFGRIEDRLILVSLPVLVMCLIFWMIVSAYPGIAVVGNLIISIAVLLIFCAVLIRLTEVAYRWIKRGSDTPNDDDLFYIPGAVGIGFLVAFDIGALVDTIIHAGQASGSRTFLMVGLLIILVIEYRAIILRYLRKKSTDEEEANQQ